MTGAGLPPIAVEAVLKLLAIAEDSAATRKSAQSVAEPRLRLELARPAARATAGRRANTPRKAKNAGTGRNGGQSC